MRPCQGRSRGFKSRLPLQHFRGSGPRGRLGVAARHRPHGADSGPATALRRGTQVVRERSAKPLCAGSNPARASRFFNPTSLRSIAWALARSSRYITQNRPLHCTTAPKLPRIFSASWRIASYRSIYLRWCSAVTSRYRSTTRKLECPKMEASVVRSTPAWTSRVANVCRKS